MKLEGGQVGFSGTAINYNDNWDQLFIKKLEKLQITQNVFLKFTHQTGRQFILPVELYLEMLFGFKDGIKTIHGLSQEFAYEFLEPSVTLKPCLHLSGEEGHSNDLEAMLCDVNVQDSLNLKSLQLRNEIKMFYSDNFLDLQSDSKFNAWIPILEMNFPLALGCAGIEPRNPLASFQDSSLWVQTSVKENPYYFAKDCEKLFKEHPMAIKRDNGPDGTKVR